MKQARQSKIPNLSLQQKEEIIKNYFLNKKRSDSIGKIGEKFLKSITLGFLAITNILSAGLLYFAATISNSPIGLVLSAGVLCSAVIMSSAYVNVFYKKGKN